MKHFTLSLLTLLFALSAFALEPVNKTTIGGLALKGYDPVAYFEQGQPVKGSKEFQASWNGARWRFATEESKQRFEASPETYAPQFGGYCAWAVSRGYTADADPTAWKIVEGRLYLNYNKKVQGEWEKDAPGNIEKGEANWPKLLEK